MVSQGDYSARAEAPNEQQPRCTQAAALLIRDYCILNVAESSGQQTAAINTRQHIAIAAIADFGPGVFLALLGGPVGPVRQPH